MLQPSMKEAPPEEYEDEDTCPHCGRGGLALDAADMEGEEVLEDEDEPDESKTKASFIEAIRKKGHR